MQTILFSMAEEKPNESTNSENHSETKMLLFFLKQQHKTLKK